MVSVYRYGVLLGVQYFRVDLHVLVSSLGALVEETVLQREVDVVPDIICTRGPRRGREDEEMRKSKGANKIPHYYPETRRGRSEEHRRE